MSQDKFSNQVIGIAIEVHKILGPGLLESAYESCLSHELNEARLAFRKQASIPVVYKHTNLDCGFRADLIIENNLLIELKAVEKILPIHEAQILTYLKLTDIKFGLILNFNSILLKNGIRRFIL
ncbi:MAG: GxxExxY protein [Rhodospirillaceae bacterium]|jgi:GxxExxY protein|nr:GxxExxY protein [Rhodospirillaceae bacterium]MBT7953902.1 GxxExxY protein [Rhodospirillaceae bacterium]